MPTVTSLGEIIQAASATMAADLARVVAEVHEAMARNAARAMADVHANFEEVARIMRTAEAPGTMLGDYMALVGERATQPEREAALERFATVLGGSLLLPPEKGGMRSRAWRALRLIAMDEGVPQREILRQEISFAVLEALAAFHEEQTRRDGRNWRKDGSGSCTSSRANITPSPIYVVARATTSAI